MTTLFLIRHGLTALTGTRLYGQTAGVDLDDRGLAQAAALAERDRPVRLAAIYSSPLERCVQTVEPLAASKRLEVRPSEALIEMDAGGWTNRTLASLRRSRDWATVQRAPSQSGSPGASPSPKRTSASWARRSASRCATRAGTWRSRRTATSCGSSLRTTAVRTSITSSER